MKRVLFLVWACELIPLLQVGQTTLPAGTGGWMEDYSRGLHAELVDGDLQSAIDAYRRVVVSRAPTVYNQQARYRCAGALRQLGRNQEATQLLQTLLQELGKDAPLRDLVSRQLNQLERGDADHFQYWQSELDQAVSAHDLARIREAGEYLAQTEGGEGVKPLCRAYGLMASTDPGRPALIQFIGAAEWPDAVPLLRSSLNDHEPAVVAAAALALGRLGDAESIPQLVGLLAARQVEVKRAAIRALGALRATEAAGALASLNNIDREEETRMLAGQSLRLIGTTTGAPTASSLPADDSNDDYPGKQCLFSEWYRQVPRTSVPQQLAPPAHAAARQPGRPRIGVVVSAMTHHGPTCRGPVPSYTAQVRKAWALQRGGYDVCLLAEAEVMQDPIATALPSLFVPPLEMFPLGSWPSCDAIVLDQIVHLSAAMVHTLAGYCEAGGSLLVCGAVGGGYCGDGVMLRRLLQVRRPHMHGYRGEAVNLIAKRGEASPLSSILPASSDNWIAPRHGSFFSHDPLGGQVLAECDIPPIWAIRLNRYGAGRVLSFNWDIGLSVQGTRDEDELFCRAIDALLAQQTPTTIEHDGGPSASPLLAMMRHTRWGLWSQAREALDRNTISNLPADRRYEAVVQLANIYLRENNLGAGAAACAKLLDRIGAGNSSNELIERMRHIPRRLRMSLVVEDEFPWWLDVPVWQRPPEADRSKDVCSVPLWIVGASTLPAAVRVQVSVPSRTASTLRVRLKGAELVDAATQPAAEGKDAASSVQEISYRPDQIEDNRVELRLTMRKWDAFASVELAGSAGR